MKKSILSILLALTLVVALMPSAFAAPRQSRSAREVDNQFSVQAAVRQHSLVPYNSRVKLAVFVSGKDLGGVTYQWYGVQQIYHEEDDTLEMIPYPIEGATGAVYMTEPVTYRSGYFCQVRDGYGNEDCVVFNLHVQNHFKILSSCRPDRLVEYGKSAALSVAPLGDDISGVRYVWYQVAYNEELGYWEETLIEGANGARIVTEPVCEQTAYICYATDRFGNVAMVEFNLYPVFG